MKRKTLLSIIGFVVVLSMLLASCTAAAVTQAPLAPTDPPKPTATAPHVPTTASTVTQAAKNPTPAQDFTELWRVKTGDIKIISVLADGTVYGLGQNLYAIFSSEGKLLKTYSIDMKTCISANTIGDNLNAINFSIQKPDGVIYTSMNSQWGGVCIITPGDPPSLTEVPQVVFSPYAKNLPYYKFDAVHDQMVSDGYGVNSINASFLESFHLQYVGVNKKAQTIGFINPDGEIKSVPIPKDYNFTKNGLEKLKIIIMPWEDIYLNYPTQDELGNITGEKNIIVNPDQSTMSLDKIPDELDYYKQQRYSPLTYFADRGEIYYKMDGFLAKYDFKMWPNFTIRARYKLPPNLSSLIDTVGMFVGNDMALYYFHDSVLIKYKFPGN